MAAMRTGMRSAECSTARGRTMDCGITEVAARSYEAAGQCRSDRRDSAAVDDVLASGNRCGSIRGEKGDQLSDLRRPAWTAKRNAAERLHQFNTRRIRVGA